MNLPASALDTLTRILEYLEDHADADLVGDPPEFRGNMAMQLQQELEPIVNLLEKEAGL